MKPSGQSGRERLARRAFGGLDVMRLSMLVAALLLPPSLALGEPASRTDGAPASQPASRPATRDAAEHAGDGGKDSGVAKTGSRPPAEFQPGVRIDWAAREVRVKATVILRQGDIELFACSPKLREHEAIVRIEARPLHVYLAMGLIGLTPGEPPAYDPDTRTGTPAHGASLEIMIRHGAPGAEQSEPIEQWMQHARTGEPLEPQDWIFAGSRMLASAESEEDAAASGIAADVEGTVIALVDFPSSLIALPEHRSDSNESLWLRPRTERIPPVNSACELIIRHGPIRLRLTGSGEIALGGHKLTLDQVSGEIRKVLKEWPAQQIRIGIDPACPAGPIEELRRALKSLDLPREQVRWPPRPADEQAR
jgi:hypothetical protein